MLENQNFINKRIAIIDFLRGFALLGVVISNFMAFKNYSIKNTGINQLLDISEEIFFGPLWILLSFLFGFGFWTLIQKLKAENQNGFWLFGKRMFWLFLIGALNACFFHIDILRDFAALGILLFITPYFSKKGLLFVTIILTICIPILRAYTSSFEFSGMNELKEISSLFISNNFWDVIKYNLKFIYLVQIKNPIYLISVHFEMLCFFLWGVLASRCKVFEDEKFILKISKSIFFFSLIGICLIWMFNHWDKSLMMKFSKIYNLKIAMEMFFATLTTSAVTLIYLSGICKKLFRYVEIYGKMTLTNYLAQSIISLLIFSGIGLGIGKNQPLWIYFLIALFVYIFQLIFSFFWLKRFKLGPVEWIWRSLSAGRILPLKNSA